MAPRDRTPHYLCDRKQWLPLIARRVPLLPDPVFLLLRRPDAAIHLAALRRITCQDKTKASFPLCLHPVQFGLWNTDLFNQIKKPSKK